MYFTGREGNDRPFSRVKDLPTTVDHAPSTGNDPDLELRVAVRRRTPVHEMGVHQFHAAQRLDATNANVVGGQRESLQLRHAAFWDPVRPAALRVG